ncbi:MAG: aldehyde dehydrogenase [Alphaproteobacteria bacterium]|nr:aldehyde dehydrogenase [Alphaproteobacteria bacterium]
MSAAPLHRRDVVRDILAPRKPELLVVGGLGSPSWDITATADNPRDFCLIGAMGLAVPVGLGLANAQPDNRILVITGDGDMLMGMGALATVANVHPRNLMIVVLDNERYGETGGQPTHTAGVTDLSAIATGAGIPTAATIRSQDELTVMIRNIHEGDGPAFYVVKIATEMPGTVLPSLDGAFAKDRFRMAVLGKA